MKSLLVVLGVAALLLCGCSVAFVPRPTPAGTIDHKTNALSEQGAGVRITVRVVNTDIAPYQVENPLSALHVTIQNLSAQQVSYPLASFVLIDGGGNQYHPIAPAEIQTMVSRNSTYLIPYPYVGYYYLQDKEQSSFSNTFNSSLPYYAQNHPQDIVLQALPEDFILPGAKVSGLVYFPLDLSRVKSFQLQVFRPGSTTTGPPAFRFPFSVEK